MGYSIVDSLQTAFSSMWVEVVHFLPTLTVAIIVLVVGVLVASSLKKLTQGIIGRLGINSALKNAGMEEVVTKAGIKLDAGVFIGTLVKWFVLLVFLVVAFDILNLYEVNAFLREIVIGYLPNVIVAVIILIAAVIIAGAVRRVVVASAQLAKISRPEFFGKVAYVAILTVAVLAALNQLKVASELIQPLFMGMVFAVSLALGLAFGLGGKDAASRVIDSINKR
jgi:hypothetical protein